MQLGEFHHKDGWFFGRQPDGSVRIRITTTNDKPVEHLIDAASWASIVAFVATGPDDSAKFAEAQRLHGVRLGVV